MAKGKPETTINATLAVLIERVDTLTRRGDEKHLELKQELKDIKENSTAKIENNSVKISGLEVNKADKKDFEELKKTIDDHFGEIQERDAKFIAKEIFDKYVEANDGVVKALVEYKTTVRGFLIAVGVISPILTAVATALIIKWLTKG